MKDCIGKMILPFLLWPLATTNLPAAQAPTPALLTEFSLPLSNTETATAMLLPIDVDRMWMVYASKDGRLGFWMMSKGTGPIPPDPIPPPPPKPTRLTIVIIEDPERTTQAQRDVLADEGWRILAKKKHNLLGILPVDLVDKRTGEPPPLLKPFLLRAEKKPLPWLILLDDAGTLVWEGRIPSTAADFTALIEKYGG